MISIIFTRNKSWISRLIRWITKSEVSHVSVLTDTIFGENMLLDVTFKGYKIIPLEQFLQHGNEIVRKFVVTHDLSTGLKLIGRWLNRPYDYKGLLSFISIFNRIFRASLENIENPKEVICSEVVTILLKKSHFPGTECLIPKKISPRDLLELLTQNSNLPDPACHLKGGV